MGGDVISRATPSSLEVVAPGGTWPGGGLLLASTSGQTTLLYSQCLGSWTTTHCRLVGALSSHSLQLANRLESLMCILVLKFKAVGIERTSCLQLLKRNLQRSKSILPCRA